MSRLFLLLVIGWLVWIILRRWWRNQKYFSINNEPLPMPTPMVRCNYCKIYIPQKHAIKSNNNWYCCNEHLETDSINQTKVN